MPCTVTIMDKTGTIYDRRDWGTRKIGIKYAVYQLGKLVGYNDDDKEMKLWKWDGETRLSVEYDNYVFMLEPRAV